MSENTMMVELPVEVFNAMTNALRNDMMAKEAALMQVRSLMAAVEQTAKLKEELRRSDEALQQQTAKLKEELRRSDEALQQQTGKLKEEQRRTEALQQKLDAILDMEMKMIEREKNLPKKK